MPDPSKTFIGLVGNDHLLLIYRYHFKQGLVKQMIDRLTRFA